MKTRVHNVAEMPEGTGQDTPMITCTGCLRASSTVMRDVSLTRDGFPSRASMYRPATDVAFLAE